MSEMKRLAVVGSRDLMGYYYVLIDYYLKRVGPVRVVSGGARGVDRYAASAARKMGMETVILPAEWDKYGKSAGFVRNSSIVENSDVVIGFWDGESRGTVDTLKKAQEANKLVIVLKCSGGVREYTRNDPYETGGDPELKRFVDALEGIQDVVK